MIRGELCLIVIPDGYRPTPGRHIDIIGGVSIIKVGETSLSANISFPVTGWGIFCHVGLFYRLDILTS